MSPMEFKSIAEDCEGELQSGPPDRSATSVGTDSRTIGPGSVFFALEGPHFDGHAYVGEAIRRGAVAVVVKRGRPCPAVPGVGVIEVDEPKAALGRLANRHRERMDILVVGIAGSNGKTTVKDLI